VSSFLFFRWIPLDIKLSLCRENGVPLVFYIFKIWQGHFVPMLGKMSQICVIGKLIIWIIQHIKKDASSSREQLIIPLEFVELANFLLTEKMTRVGTVKLKKPESAAVFMNRKQSLFFYLCCTIDLTPLSTYQQETGLSSCHNSIMTTCEFLCHKQSYMFPWTWITFRDSYLLIAKVRKLEML
jgi:hypothetical protein